MGYFSQRAAITKNRYSRADGCDLLDTDPLRLYERKPLYEKYADYVVDCEGKSIREVVEEMTKLWKKEISASKR